MEGVSAEAASLAGHLKLGRLIVLYDSNDISLDGDLNKAFSESVENRFKAYGWQYLRVEDGNNLEEISKAIEEAKKDTERPTLIEVKTVIGYGSPNLAGTHKVHGAPLGEEEAKLTKAAYKWTFEEDFYVPEEVYEHFKKLVWNAENGWKKNGMNFSPVTKKNILNSVRNSNLRSRESLPEGWDAEIPQYETGTSLASRASSGEVLNAIAKHVPYFFGGSADLASSNKTTINNDKDFLPGSYEGRNIWFGVREFAMGAALNGMALHGGLKVFGGTFFVFSDYLRPAIRLAALMGVPVTYVFTHDSIAVGEDGPTHEPIEQLASLRAMPNLSVIRPADGNETAAAWKLAVQSKDQPTALVLSRQNLPTLPGTKEKADEGVARGAYVISPAQGETPQALLLASGSEVGLAVSAQEKLREEGIDVAVVSMPSWDRFEKQPESYKEIGLTEEREKTPCY